MHTLLADQDDANLVYHALEELSSDYLKIGISFGLPPHRVKEIEQNHPRDAGAVLLDVVVLWVKQEYNVKKFGVPCWRRVVKAAIDVKNILVAKKIADNHPGMNFTKLTPTAIYDHDRQKKS